MKLIIVGLSILLFTFSVWAGTFVENFDEQNLKDWQELRVFDVKIAPGSWKIIDGTLEATVMDKIGPRLPLLLTIGDDTWKNYEIQFDVMPLEEHGPGLFVIAARITEDWGLVCMNGVLSLEHGSNASCFGGKLPSNILKTFGETKYPPLKLKEWSTLKLLVDKANMIFSINGKKVLESPLLPHFEGGVGFGLANYTARFDNITVIGEGVPDKGKLSVMPQAKLVTTWGLLKNF